MHAPVASCPPNSPRDPSPYPAAIAKATLSKGGVPRPPISRLYNNELPRPSAGAAWQWRHDAAGASHAGRSPAELQQTPLWQGAWVGWLTCQAVLLLLVEGTELASDPRLALVTRVLLVTAFVAAFRRPCFETGPQRGAFTCAVVVAEVVIAGCCDRLADTTGWPLWTAIGVGLSLWATALGSPHDEVNAHAR